MKGIQRRNKNYSNYCIIIERQVMIDGRPMFCCKNHKLHCISKTAIDGLNICENTFPIGLPHYNHIFDIQKWSYPG